MNALRDFEQYWQAQCESLGGTVSQGDTIRLHGPQGGYPTNGLLRVGEGLDLNTEIQQWQDAGAPFSILATNPTVGSIAKSNGLQAQNSFGLLDLPVHDLGPPAHDVMENDVASFVELQIQSHSIPPFMRENLTRAWTAMVAAGQCHLFVVHDDGPAGCAALFTGGGNAGLYAFGVLANKRRRGIGTSLAQACMRRALALGLRKGTAAVTPDGMELAQSMGVEESVTAQQYVWTPKAQT